jgi:ubiquinone/menaquinone biosynthesis C-methylase UbiE
MRNSKVKDVESTLKQSGIHKEWASKYRTSDNEHFYNMAFDFISASFGNPDGATVVDAGCGSCAKSKKLADHGFKVIGIDFSKSALDMARKALKDTPYEQKIELRQQNLTAMTLSNDSVEYLVCWGVLMHIPEIEKAVAELKRIIKTGGRIAISEGNMNSFQSRILRSTKKILGLEKSKIYILPAGVEYWEETDEGWLMTRHANIKWLIREFEKHGMKLEKHTAGQFFEFYWAFPIPILKKLIHKFNYFWFKLVRLPVLAYGNILIFRKN